LAIFDSYTARWPDFIVCVCALQCFYDDDGDDDEIQKKT